VQHQLRAHTPDDAKALKATVSTYPMSDYDLAEVLQSLGIGEAIVTVMNEKGAPSPVAWTRLRAPQGSMEPTPDAAIAAAVAASPLLSKYQATAVATGTANEVLAEQQSQAQAAQVSAQQALEQQRELDAMQKQQMKDAERQAREDLAAQKRAERERIAEEKRQAREAERLRGQAVNAGVKIARVLVGKLFGRSR
jgi:hypothetical protein